MYGKLLGTYLSFSWQTSILAWYNTMKAQFWITGLVAIQSQS